MTTKIEWCDETSNPFHGCKHGCEWCYARRHARRLGDNPKAQAYYEAKRHGVDPFEPCFSFITMGYATYEWNRGKPRRIFLGSMGDLGGDWDYHVLEVHPDPKIDPENKMPTFVRSGRTADQVQRIIIDCVRRFPQHTFLLLTKNPAGLADKHWPGNVHVGVSGSNPGELSGRIPVLLSSVKASFKWVSIEPLLSNDINRLCDEIGELNWVVVGAQTGPDAPDPKEYADCAKRIVDWCRKRSVPCFVKDNMQAADPDWDWQVDLPRQGS